jgi:inositol-phosphate phosphatase/L-galactose 1-phosphate phosphatase/histidinol-phosphatase
MSLKLSDISSYLSFAKKLSNTSEGILKKTPSNRIKINFKSDKSPVTKIDMEIERKLRSMINKRFPDHGIFGEEYKNKSNNSAFLWVIDPIDGTKNFINGNSNFGTLISLCIDYTPVIGIINCPDIKKTWIGIRDNGAYCNGKKINKSSNNLPLSSKNKKYNSLIKKTKYATFGGDCVQYGLLAEKRIPLVVESFLKPYDYIPLINIVEESGGIISDWKGNPLDFKSNGDVIASISKKAHQQFIKI